MNIEEARVLIVDDEVALCGIFAKWLSKAGCRRIRTAANGHEAIEAIRQEAIDVLITDVQMPVMDGVTLVRTLAQQGERIRTIIFVSGFGDVDRREMYNLGVENFLAKPFRLEELASAIDQAIAERDELWQTPMETAPRQSVHLSVDENHPCSARDAEATEASRDGEPCFSLGRGGFSARFEEPLFLGKIAFECVFSSAEETGDATPNLRGQGYVRWRSRLDRTVGIEFAYIESPGREWVVGRIAQNNPRPFIPALASAFGPAPDST